MSASEPVSQIPWFRDRLGDRVIVPQPSGTLLECLYFCEALAKAPFFARALKDRFARLSTFTHSSYCRIRRIQHIGERDGRAALVSAHVAGRRLAEILDVAARADLKPTTAGVLAVTRQMMASVALLHDFAPDGFHGALGPDRLILAGEGRVVIAEHVLGTVVEQAVTAWGGKRVWREFRLATLPGSGSAQLGRRNDVLQVGLVTLAMVLGRPLSSAEYPDELGQLLQEATETKADGAHVPLRTGLRNWLERTLSLRGDSSYRTLLECQKALGQLLQDDGYGASSVAWDAFVGACEAAAVRVPVVVVVPDSASGVEVTSETAPAGEAPGEPLEGPVESAQATPMSKAAIPLGSGEQAAAVGRDDRAISISEDPFGSWPVPVPPEHAATLLETFLAGTPLAGTASPVQAPSVPPPAAAPAVSDSWAPAQATPAQPETLFEAPRREPAPVVVVRNDANPPASVHWEEPTAPAARATSVADWHAVDPKLDPSYLILNGDEHADAEAGTAEGEESADVPEAPNPKRRIELMILVVLTIVATAAAVYAPYVWTVLYDGRMTFGSVMVESDPPGAIITVDGQVRGQTPAELKLRAGEHVLELQIGGSAKSKKLSVSAHARLTEKMTLPEAGARGGFRISTYPTTGRITIDGIPRGAAPVKVTDLTPGTHTLVVETPLGTQEQDVVVQTGMVSQLAVPTASWIKVTAPYELRVYENGRMLGTTGSAPVMVQPGRHHFEFVNQGIGLKLRQFVDAVPGQLVMVPIELPVGMMNLFSDLTAEVSVDGKKAGDTPLSSLPVPLGSHEIVFRHPKYGEVRYTVSVTLAAPVQLNVTFRK